MKLLVTGGAGFIGSNFIDHILKKYPTYEVINLDLLTYAGDKDSLKALEGDARYRFVEGDICNRSLVDTLVNECDAIVHFAAESHVDRSIADASAFIQTNIIGTYTLLESARAHGNKRFHHISTDEVFGQLSDTDAPFNEATPYDPRSPYSASKASSDHLVMAYYHTYNLPITVSNCSNNYGPYQFPEKLISLAVTNLLEEKQIPVYGDGKQVRDWLYVEDHCKAVDLILHKGVVGQVYCVGGGSEKKNMDVIHTILECMNKDERSIVYVADRAGHDRRYAKIAEEFGWKPEVDFKTGLEKTIEWYRNNESWWKSKKN
jgi:dTDP-glucose 4,6-dehydratase